MLQPAGLMQSIRRGKPWRKVVYSKGLDAASKRVEPTGSVSSLFEQFSMETHMYNMLSRPRYPFKAQGEKDASWDIPEVKVL